MNSKSKVYFFFPLESLNLGNRSSLKRFIEKLFKTEKKQIDQINYIFCDNKSIRKINKQYLKHNYATDIITFDLSEGKEIAADIYISVEMVRDNAKSLGVSLKSEIHRVIFHGALHLCGYKDKKTTEINKMRGKEDQYLNKYGVSTV
ncbi:MAG: rRNA maturation RNase YbeY [Bacteroidetes bacterium]|nr:rRNA maturation RNase YbeY [Bacteroidota bacterium]